MLTIGVVGGVASGKTQVGKCFEQLGLIRLDGDVVGHEVLTQTEVKSALRERWGNGIFDSKGAVDRNSVAKIVFSDAKQATDELEFLEQTTHPRIRARLSELRDAAKREELPGVVLDAALMIKAGWDKLCDHIVFVDVPRPVRLRRVLDRGWTEAQFDARERAQIPVSAKRRRADTIIDNSGPLEETCEQVRSLWATLSAQVNSADP